VSLASTLSRPPRRLVRAALWANLAGQVVIVVTGGAVRLTGSGLGCSDWPACEPGQFAPVRHEATSFHPFIEFGNRTLTGVLVLLAVGALWVVWRQPGRPRGLKALAAVPLLGVLAQAVLGGMAVLVDLHPAVVGSHLLLSMVLISASTVLVLREAEPDVRARWAVAGRTRALVRTLVSIGAAVQVLGTVVTGAGPHSGDDDAPYRYALDPVVITRAHSLAVWAFVIVLVALALDLRRVAASSTDPAVARGLRRTAEIGGLVVAQGAIGYLQYLTGLPAFLVGLHMLGASLMVVAQTAQVVTLRPRADDAGPDDVVSSAAVERAA
jgi:cytochrome c oxidase assembly protein subunit 15